MASPYTSITVAFDVSDETSMADYAWKRRHKCNIAVGSSSFIARFIGPVTAEIAEAASFR